MKLTYSAILLLFLAYPKVEDNKISNNYLTTCSCDTTKAKKIAIKAFRKQYGFFHTRKYSPYNITNENDSTWTISGTLHTDVGGTPHAQVDKRDCSILNVTHYK